MKLFELHRTEDESGVSGTGVVAEGCISTTGKVALFWHVESVHIDSVTIYENIGEVEKIHGHGGKTKIVYIAPPEKENKLSQITKLFGLTTIKK